MPNQSGVWTLSQQFQARGQGLWPAPPGAPTIGTATAGVSLCASVTFTAPACTGYPAGVTGYLVTSTPGCKTASGSSSPLTVTGLTCGTSYTFKVKAQNSAGLYGACSAASNSAKAFQKTCATYTAPGTYSWVAPTGVTSVSVVAVGGGGFGGGGLSYGNNISVTPGTSYSVKVGGPTQQSYFVNASTLFANGGSCSTGGGGGGTARNGGGSGGSGFSGAGGAGGYSGNGGNGGNCGVPSGFAGTGGAGGGGGKFSLSVPAGGGGGGGVGILGEGASGAAGGQTGGGKGGSGGTDGGNGYFVCCVGLFAGSAGSYGGGGACGSNGAVRIVWAGGSRGTPSFPSTNVGA